MVDGGSRVADLLVQLEETFLAFGRVDLGCKERASLLARSCTKLGDQFGQKVVLHLHTFSDAHRLEDAVNEERAVETFAENLDFVDELGIGVWSSPFWPEDLVRVCIVFHIELCVGVSLTMLQNGRRVMGVGWFCAQVKLSRSSALREASYR